MLLLSPLTIISIIIIRATFPWALFYMSQLGYDHFVFTKLLQGTYLNPYLTGLETEAKSLNDSPNVHKSM